MKIALILIGVTLFYFAMIAGLVAFNYVASGRPKRPDMEDRSKP